MIKAIWFFIKWSYRNLLIFVYLVKYEKDKSLIKNKFKLSLNLIIRIVIHDYFQLQETFVIEKSTKEDLVGCLNKIYEAGITK